MAIVEFKNVDIIFGRSPKQALALLDQGRERESILEETGCVVGVANASITIEPGEICVLMGLSGSGKSTLLRSVNGLNKVSRGEVLVEDEGRHIDVTRCDSATLRRLRMNRISMVFQQFALLPWRSVQENVGFGLELRGMPRSEREKVVKQKLELVGLDKWKDKFANELSGGMQQRVGLARAFATDADILLMDEPFSALDPLIRTHLQDELLELQTRLKKTIIFVSHDLDEALKLGTHIAIMEGGHIVQYGEPESIVLSPSSQYVADFVAHMNPLNVLRGASLLRPVDNMQRKGDELLLDWSGQSRITLDPAGRPQRVSVNGTEGRLVPYEDDHNLSSLGREDIVTATPEIIMRRAIEIRKQTGTPIVFLEDGKMIGVIGDEEIYQGILRQTSIAERTDKSEEVKEGAGETIKNEALHADT
jgi:glycine betaine/proline transport system ATP-binding protein